MLLKFSYCLGSLSSAEEDIKCRQNESKSLRTKKSSHRTKVESKLNKISGWDYLCAALEGTEEITDAEEMLGSGNESEDVDCESATKSESCRKDDSEDAFSEDRSGCTRLHGLSD